MFLIVSLFILYSKYMKYCKQFKKVIKKKCAYFYIFKRNSTNFII